MAIVVTISPELEEFLRDKADRQGQDLVLSPLNCWLVF